MLVRLSKAVIVLTVVTLVGTSGSWGQEAKKPQWKDRAEYDLVAAITKETNNTKKLELLNTWKEKYPNTDFKLERLQHYLVTYQALNQPTKMVETAQAMLAINPKDVQALYWLCTLVPRAPKPNESDFSMAEKSAHGLLEAVEETFAPSKRPATTSEADWNKAKNDMVALAHKTLGWVAMQRKNWEQAETEFQKSLAVAPNAGEVSYWMGTVMIAQKKPEKSTAAIYHIARAASYTGPGALNPQGRQEVNKYLEKLYTQYHGSSNGLAELRAQAQTQALPPPDFQIKTAAQVAFDKEEQFKKEHPMLALWQNTKKALLGEGGAEFWEGTVKRSLMPGGVGGVQKFRGRLVSQKPARNPKELVLAIDDGNTPEVTLNLDEPMRGSAEPGAEISFEGIATEFTKDPFMLTFEVEKKNVEGWPEPTSRRRTKKGR